MLIAFTYLPGFVTMVFRGMPTVWRGRHRLIFCWLIFMQAVSPGAQDLGRDGQVDASYHHRLALWALAQSRLLERASPRELVGAGSRGHVAATLPMALYICLATGVMLTNVAPRIPWRRKGASASIIPGFLACASWC